MGEPTESSLEHYNRLLRDFVLVRGSMETWARDRYLEILDSAWADVVKTTGFADYDPNNQPWHRQPQESISGHHQQT